MSGLAEFLLARFAEDPRMDAVWREALRRIVLECAEILAVDGWEYDDAPDLAWGNLCSLALPYASHPDCREEWRA